MPCGQQQQRADRQFLPLHFINGSVCLIKLLCKKKREKKTKQKHTLLSTSRFLTVVFPNKTIARCC